jgi:CcmD family protein
MSFFRAMVLVVLALVALLAAPAASRAAQQPPAPANQEYVPVDTVEEQLPAAPLVIGAYSVVWLALVLYLWSIWRRLARVEREIAQVSRRIEAGGKR